MLKEEVEKEEEEEEEEEEEGEWRRRKRKKKGRCKKKLKRKNVTDCLKAEIFAMAPDSMAPERRSADSAIFWYPAPDIRGNEYSRHL